MIYKVCFSKYKKYSDRVDKFMIGTEVAYTDAPISDIPEILNEYLAKKEQYGDITCIEKMNGIVLPKVNSINDEYVPTMTAKELQKI